VTIEQLIEKWHQYLLSTFAQGIVISISAQKFLSATGEDYHKSPQANAISHHS